MATNSSPFTASQAELIKTLAVRTRLNPVWSARSTRDFKPAAITSLRTKGLVKTDYYAIFGTTYIELTELGLQVACALHFQWGMEGK